MFNCCGSVYQVVDDALKSADRDAKQEDIEKGRQKIQNGDRGVE